MIPSIVWLVVCIMAACFSVSSKAGWLLPCKLCDMQRGFSLIPQPPGWLLLTTAKGAVLSQECLEGVWGRTRGGRLEMSITKTEIKQKAVGVTRKRSLRTRVEKWNVRNRMCCIFLSLPEPGVRRKECSEVEVLTCQWHHSFTDTAG